MIDSFRWNWAGLLFAPPQLVLFSGKYLNVEISSSVTEIKLLEKKAIGIFLCQNIWINATENAAAAD